MDYKPDPTLKRLGRDEIVEHMETVLKAVAERNGKDLALCVQYRSGEECGMFRVSSDDERRVTLLEPILGSFAALTERLMDLGVLDRKELFMSPKEFLDEMREAEFDDVLLSDGCAVGKVLAVMHGDRAMVMLLPVPVNIDEVQAWISDRLERSCQLFMAGRACWSCPRFDKCGKAEEAERQAREHFAKAERQAREHFVKATEEDEDAQS